MTICQFFLQGRCRYGQNCKFEHSYNNEDRSNRNPINSQQLSNVVKQMVEEVILVEKGGQWPLSSFSPVRGGPSIPGWEDVSPEEVRWKMYEARAKGNLNQCIHEINQMYSNAEKMRNLIKEPTMERVNLIVNLLKGKREPSNSSNQFSNSPPSSNIFGGSTQSTNNQNIFRNSTAATGSHGSIFGGSSPSGNVGNVYGGSNQPNANIFGGATGFSKQNIFGGSSSANTFCQNTFSSPQTSSQNLFSSSSSGSNNIFSNVTGSSQNVFSSAGDGKNQNVSNAFLPSNNSGIFSNQTSTGSLFGSNSTFSQIAENQNRNQSNIFCLNQNENIQNTFNNTGNVFNTPQNSNKSIFGNGAQQNSFNIKEFDSSIYSKLENLNEEEVKSFTSATFVFGKIPLKPPPKEYCR